MRFTFASGIRASCVALLLILAPAAAAESQGGIVGASRAEVLARKGEPRSVMIAGGREVLFFARERVVLRKGVVVEVELLAPDAAPRRTPSGAAIQLSDPTPDETTGSLTASPAPAATDAAVSSTPGVASNAEPANARSAERARSAEPEIAIKSIQPPSGAYTRPAPLKKAVSSGSNVLAPAAEPAAPVVPAVITPVAKPPPTERSSGASEPGAAKGGAQTPGRASPSTTTMPPSAATADVVRVATQDAAVPIAQKQDPSLVGSGAAPSAEPAAPAAPRPVAKKRRPPSDSPQSHDESEGIFTGQTYLIAFLVIGVGGGYLWWQRRQRQLELVATAVSNPFSPELPAPAVAGARFTPEHLAKLDWKHFEQLVAAYYGKTGVVAQRTKAGPDAPVHIKISWKGESRPFALVQCISRPEGLIGPKPLEDLLSVLGAEDIRRGYIVTTGKFNVMARDFAEEKHLTLLPGDLFIEKVNALPESARAEIVQEVMAGDTSTPACPRCESPMVHHPEDPATWRCPTHSDVSLPVR